VRDRPHARVGCRSHCGELRTDFRPLRLNGTYHAPSQQQRQGIGKRLIAAQGDGDVAGAIDHLVARLR
jgi:hypothetical protein